MGSTFVNPSHMNLSSARLGHDFHVLASLGKITSINKYTFSYVGCFLLFWLSFGLVWLGLMWLLGIPIGDPGYSSIRI